MFHRYRPRLGADAGTGSVRVLPFAGGLVAGRVVALVGELLSQRETFQIFSVPGTKLASALESDEKCTNRTVDRPWFTDRRYGRYALGEDPALTCHRSLENRPVIIGSKPAMFM